MLFTALLFALNIPPGDPQIPNRQPQIAVAGPRAAVVYGAGDTIFVVTSQDRGTTWSQPVAIPSGGRMSLGMRRGPRIALTRDAIVVSAVAGAQGKGRDGDVLAWHSTDDGKSWSGPVKVNDVSGSAREGMHAMAANSRTVFATWLDLRSAGTRLYGSVSTDSGQNWSENRLVYESPSGTICQCCHPNAHVDAEGNIRVLFRNALEGSRDLYTSRSGDGGRSFGIAMKLGEGTWLLEACPMDGGAFTVDKLGRPVAVWRRENDLFLTVASGAEQKLGTGKHPVVAETARGRYLAWMEGKSIRYRGPDSTDIVEGAFPAIAALADRGALLAYEHAGEVVIRKLD